MPGFRARLGFILAPGNTIFETEVQSMLPHGVSAHFTRMPSKASPRNQIAQTYARWAKNVEEHVKIFLLADVKCIALANTVGSLALGPSGDGAIIKRMERASGGLRCTTALSSVMSALQKVGVRKIGVVFPYFGLDEQLDSLLLDSFAAHGISVRARQNVPLDETSPLERQIPNLDPVGFYNLGMKISRTNDDLEAIVSPATNLPSLEVLADLEHDTGKYVITGAQAIIWSSLRLSGIPDKIQGRGRLLAEN